MKKNSSVMMLQAVAVAALLVATQAQATIAYNYANNLVGNQNNGTFSLGMVFSVDTASGIIVDQLGAFDSGGNGLGGNIDVAIYSVSLSGNTIASGTLAVSPVTFSSGNPGALLSGTTTRLKDISDVTLAQGTYMIVANNYGSGGAEVNYNHGYTPLAPNPNSVNTGGGLVSYLGNYHRASVSSWASSLPTGWTYDIASDPGPGTTLIPRYAAGNFDFTPVPEAATFGAAAVGLLGLVYGARHLRIRRKAQGA